MNFEKNVDTVIIGGGNVGAAIAHHLADLGKTDVCVLERGTISNLQGSTGHAPGLVVRNNYSTVMSEWADYSTKLYTSLPDGGSHMELVGSIEASRHEKNTPVFEAKLAAAKSRGFKAKLLASNEVGEMLPYVDAGKLALSLLVEGDGVVDAKSTVQSLLKNAESKGIAVHENTEVLSITTHNSRVTAVETTGGRIACNTVVLAVGIWGAVFLEKMGVKLPLVPVQHPYLYTKAAPVLGEPTSAAVRPMFRDMDNLFYLREHGNQFGYGWYNHAPLGAEMQDNRAAELPYVEQVFDSKLPFDLLPVLRTLPVIDQLNGVFSMTPDGGPLLGEIDEVVGLFLAEAVWVTHAGGVGRSAAQMLTGNTLTQDVSKFDANRFSSYDAQRIYADALSLYNNIYHWPLTV
ncbi:NAD(P)/FAD-dependent oxidoreductase [Maritalea porphyrae]|uniref:FAD dependent oxidoreductase domain-containing protein n=1 Tax=Maritalea porphyrae TaxID=880732 RepID=A0ABQ5UT33_9HYPH|nr:FAD-binding oxidoreductase [Maritalea porphyrae]GLQ18054.1 hypothetical protein GCM10007879_23030 [Maritalea porphyrae]